MKRVSGADAGISPRIALLMARLRTDRKHEEPRQVMSLTGLLFPHCRVDAEFHSLIHRFTHDFLRAEGDSGLEQSAG
jgi:hypothetical protein